MYKKHSSVVSKSFETDEISIEVSQGNASQGEEEETISIYSFFYDRSIRTEHVPHMEILTDRLSTAPLCF